MARRIPTGARVTERVFIKGREYLNVVNRDGTVKMVPVRTPRKARDVRPPR